MYEKECEQYNRLVLHIRKGVRRSNPTAITSGPAIYVHTNYYHEIKTTLLCITFISIKTFFKRTKKQTFSDNGIPFTLMQTWLLELFQVTKYKNYCLHNLWWQKVVCFLVVVVVGRVQSLSQISK